MQFFYIYKFSSRKINMEIKIFQGKNRGEKKQELNLKVKGMTEA